MATRGRVAAKGNGFSPWSRKRHLANARIAFNAAVRWGYVSTNPFAHIKAERCAPRKWHHIKPEEFQRVLEVLSDLRWKAFYHLAFTTGARFGEMFNLTWADIDFDRCTLTIQDRRASTQLPPFHVKDHESRRLLLPQRTVEALLAWQAEAPERVPIVLLTAERWRTVRNKWQLCRSNRPWKKNAKTGQLEWGDWENRHMVNNVLRNVRGHMRRAGIQVTAPITIHTFRKSFGQNHADAGTPIHVLQRLMGHASITTTREFYLQAADANDRDALARYQALIDAAGEKTCVRLLYEASESRSDRNGTSVSSCPTKTCEFGATRVDSKPRPGDVEVLAGNDALADGFTLAFPFVWGPQGVTDGESGALATASGSMEGER